MRYLLAALALALGLSLAPGGPILALLPDPGVPRNLSACGLSVPGSAWPMHTVYDGVVGADGVDTADLDSDGDPDAVSPFEQAGDVVVCLHPGFGAVRSASSWSCATLDAALSTAEGAAFGDFDADGLTDVCAVGQGGLVRLYFRPASVGDILDPGDWATTDLTAAEGLSKGWMQCEPALINNDAHVDVVLGGTAGTADGELTVMVAPSADKRTGANWTRSVVVASLGRVMSVQPRAIDGDSDLDLLYSNRASPGTVGLVWMECTNAACTTWTEHVIDSGAGGPRMMFILGDVDGDGDDLDLLTGFDGAWLARYYRFMAGEAKWVATRVRNPGSVGVFQAGAIGDLDLDGYPDLVVTTSAATTGLSGVVWLRGGPDKWARGEISGPSGATVEKYDDPRLLDLDNDGDLDVLTTDQGNEVDTAQGMIWFENPCR